MSLPVEQYQQVLSQFEDDVDEAIDAVFRADGYVDADGNPSESSMRTAALEIFTARSIVSSKAERSRKALMRGEFCALVFPSGPKDDDANLDPVQNRVLAKLLTTVWGLTQTSRSGYIQRQLEQEDETKTLVLCRCKVYRDGEPRQAVYATDSESLIKEDAVDKEIKSLVRRASALRKDLNMIIERHPKMSKAIATQLGLELRKIDAELALGDTSVNGSRQQIAA